MPASADQISYTSLSNLPTIENVVVVGNKTLNDFGIKPLSENEYNEVIAAFDAALNS
jgi:hypothetical protein